VPFVCLSINTVCSLLCLLYIWTWKTCYFLQLINSIFFIYVVLLLMLKMYSRHLCNCIQFCVYYFSVNITLVVWPCNKFVSSTLVKVSTMYEDTCRYSNIDKDDTTNCLCFMILWCLIRILYIHFLISSVEIPFRLFSYDYLVSTLSNYQSN
jgi:hypothetical protein